MRRINFLSAGVVFLAFVLSSLIVFSCKKEEQKPIITGFELTDSRIDLSVGDTYDLKYVVTPAELQESAVIVWDVTNDAIINVSATGTVTALSEGKAKVIARCETFQSSVTVNVTDDSIVMERIELSESDVTLYVGESFQLEYIITPAELQDQVQVTWKSDDETVATVNNGLINTLSYGNCVITASCAGKSASVNVTVLDKEDKVTSIDVSEDEVEVTLGDTYRIVYTITPSHLQDVVDVIFESEDLSVATVSGDGLVYTHASGYADILVSCQDCSDYIRIIVPNAVTNIDLAEESVQILEGKTYKIEYEVTPAYLHDRQVNWVSSDPSVATVDEYGVVKGIVPGECYITGTCDVATATLYVEVLEADVQGISLVQSDIQICENESFQLEYVITPSHLQSTADVMWSIDDGSIAKVNANGVVTGISEGICEVTVSCDGYSASVLVVVLNEINGYAFVDLGLPSGLKWATCNVGATRSYEYGDYYAWAETEPKTYYSSSNGFAQGMNLSDFSGDPTYDAATQNWGGTWRTPTKEDFRELVQHCTLTIGYASEVKGIVVKGPNGNSIFLPYAGCFELSSKYFEASEGYYMSSTPSTVYEDYNDFLWLNQNTRDLYYLKNYIGQSVRPVSD
ncbi:MAG: Ig-like domain-containing protein [Bacteroidales bacterium]|nr:Ig-like domain-containing protein [Bacteroidales bacterium]